MNAARVVVFSLAPFPLQGCAFAVAGGPIEWPALLVLGGAVSFWIGRWMASSQTTLVLWGPKQAQFLMLLGASTLLVG